MKYITTYEKFDEMSKESCNICGEETYNDSEICDDCKKDKSEIEVDDTKVELKGPPQSLPAYPKSQNIYKL